MGFIEAILSFIMRQVGLRTDTPSSTGSVHAKIAELRNYAANKTKHYIISNNLQLSADTERNTLSRDPAIAKVFYLARPGRVKVMFELRGTNDTTGHAKLYSNDNEVSETFSKVGANYSTFTAYVTVAAGQLSLKFWTSGIYIVGVRNVRVYYDEADDIDSSVLTD